MNYGGRTAKSFYNRAQIAQSITKIMYMHPLTTLPFPALPLSSMYVCVCVANAQNMFAFRGLTS